MITQTWMPLVGNVTVVDGVITHKPNLAVQQYSATPSAAATPQPPHAVLRSNLEFEQGTITCEVKLLDAESRVQLLLPAEPVATSPDSIKTDTGNPDLAVGLNVLGAPYGFAFWNAAAWEPLGGTGHGSSLPLNEWISLRVTARGSVVELYVQGVKVAWTNRTLKSGQIGLLFQGNSESMVHNLQVATDVPTCFVVMQFTEEFDILYRDVVRPVCESHGYKVIRGDDIFTAGQIMEDIIRSIKNASLIIADVTPDNANVFYEVGFAHAINKPTILLSDKKRERLPFDISGFRTLFYDNTIGGKSVVETRLKQHLEVLRPK